MANRITVKVHYNRFRNDYEGWNIWTWQRDKNGKSLDGKGVNFSEDDDYGRVATFTLDSIEGFKDVGFIVRKSVPDNEWQAKDIDTDRFIQKECISEDGTVDLYLKQGNAEIRFSRDEIDNMPFKKNIEIDIHYSRYDDSYDGWNLWIWKEKKADSSGEKGFPVHFTKTDNYGKVARVKLDDIDDIKRMGLRLRKSTGENDWQDKDIDADRFITSEELFANRQGFYLHQDCRVIANSPNIIDRSTRANDERKNSYKKLKHLYNGAEFHRDYYYEKDDLGVNYTEKAINFKIWAPIATEVSMLLYNEGEGGNPLKEIPMLRGEKGTWYYTSDNSIENLKGKFYTYRVNIDKKYNIDGEICEIVDPYAKTVGINGHRGEIIDFEETNPIGWKEHKKPILLNQEDSIIYELSVRDFTIDESSDIENKGKFLGLTERGKRVNNEKVGVDHLIKLGVTHVHILPIFDFHGVDEKYPKGSYNWGYNPENYNAPEGSYSTDPFNGDVRVKELKEMIKVLHDNGIRVIMDVVYNHTSKSQDSNLNELLPGYYHRLTDEGKFSNGSGCGNEIASERPMVRKFIVDSIKNWANEYKIDGFRFDLMGLCDIETINCVRRELDKIDPTILVYGEGWTGGMSVLPEGSRADRFNTIQMDRVGQFNDIARDGIKGGTFNNTEAGFVTGNGKKREDVKLGIVGNIRHKQVDQSRARASQPIQTISYVSSHDNQTLWDRINFFCPNESEEDKIKIQKLCSSIVLTSQGVSFLHSGVEFLRTKGGEDNSYNLPDSVNMIDWERKSKYKEVYKYHKRLIKLRKEHPAFRMRNADEINKNLEFIENGDENLLAYKIKNNANGDYFNKIAVIHNTSCNSKEVNLYEDGWAVVLDDRNEKITKLEKRGDKVTVSGRSTLILADVSGVENMISLELERLHNKEQEKMKIRDKILGSTKERTLLIQ